MTLVYIPVLAAGCILGPREAAAMGVVFGLASMWKASAFYVGAGDMIFSPVMSGKPLQSIVLSVVSRGLFGWIAGLLYSAAKRGRHPAAGVILVSSVGRTLHTVLVYGFMGLLFPETGFRVASAFSGMLSWDFIPFLVVCDGLVYLCFRLWDSAYVRTLFFRIHSVDQNEALAPRRRGGMLFMILLVALSCASVAAYSINRMWSVMRRHGISLSEESSYDILHLQIQFLMGMMSLAVLVMLLIILYQKNQSYLRYEARLDSLTGILNRQQFFEKGEQLLKTMEPAGKQQSRCFIILDLDSFKEINDRYGHPAGDRVLRETADSLLYEAKKNGKNQFVMEEA